MLNIKRNLVKEELLSFKFIHLMEYPFNFQILPEYKTDMSSDVPKHYFKVEMFSRGPER